MTPTPEQQRILDAFKENMLKSPPLNEANFIRCICLGGIHGIEIDHKSAWQLFRYGRVMAEDYVFNRADMERLQELLTKILKAAADED